MPLLIASSKPARTPAFERAVALARASGARLRIVALDHVKLLEVMGLFDPRALAKLRDAHLQSYQGWLDSQVEEERSRALMSLCRCCGRAMCSTKYSTVSGLNGPAC